MNITLDESHVYRVDGIIKPGVTSILDYNGLISEFCKQEFAAQKGSAIHVAAKLLFQDELDWDSIDKRIFPYVHSLALFVKHTGFKATSTETSGYYEHLDYCGTWDVTGMFPAGSHDGDFAMRAKGYNMLDDWVIDLKSGAPAKWHKLQSAAYLPLSLAGNRGALYLQADGTMAKFVEHKDPGDWSAFYSCLQIFHKETKTQQELEEHRANLKLWVEQK
jgi:hypothetical protein